MKKKWIAICSVVLLCLSTTVVYGSTTNYVLQNWDLVDSGKHLDWDGKTNYMTEWYNAVNTWNAYKPGVIRADRWDIIQDVAISDKATKDGATFATTYAIGKIVFYQDTMDKMTSTQRQATITHEIGHALGLDHNKKETSIMRQGYKNFVNLDEIDKAGYDAAYLKY